LTKKKLKTASKQALKASQPAPHVSISIRRMPEPKISVYTVQRTTKEAIKQAAKTRAGA
jgi:hypothetical protein